MTEVLSRPHDRGRPRQFDEKQALKDAITVFRQYGYEAAGTDRLAHAMGMKKQSIYRTFGNKSALFDRCFDTYHADITHALKASLRDRPNLAAALKASLLDAVDFFHKAQAQDMACMIIVIAAASPDKAGRSQRALHDIRTTLGKLLAPYLDKDHGKSDELAMLLVAYFQSLAVSARTGASEAELTAMADLYFKSLQHLTGDETT